MVDLMPSFLVYHLVADNVLKDQLVVYDNVNNRIGWKNFDCKF